MRLHDYLDFRARLHPESDFALFGDTRLSYAQAQGASRRLANALRSAGLEPGDRVAVLAKNSLECVLLFYAASRVGVVPVPLNYRLAGPEWSYIVNDAGARMVVARGEFVAALEPVRAELGGVERWIAIGADAPGWEAWDGFVAGGSEEAVSHHVSSDDDVYQMYTSGTTGRPKGAVIQQRALAANLYQNSMVMGGEPGERWLIVAPLYHAAGAMTTFSCVQWGGCMVIHEDFHPGHVVQALSEGGIAATTLVPAMIQACLVMVPDAAERSYDALRLIVYGASPIAEQTLRQAMDVFGCGFAQAYGMTETTAVLTWLRPEDHVRALSGEAKLLLSAGRPNLGTEVQIMDSEDRPVPAGEIGEVCARGPQLMRGYWNLPEASKESLRGGWMHTGDAGRMDGEGFVYIEDRVKDMIVSGGENVYPREVEDALFQHPAVADAAVIGVPDDKWGETVKAVVVLREGRTADAEEIMEFCRGRLGGYKCPRSVDFLDALPRNPTGKVLKKDLREPYWKGKERRVAGS